MVHEGHVQTPVSSSQYTRVIKGERKWVHLFWEVVNKLCMTHLGLDTVRTGVQDGVEGRVTSPGRRVQRGRVWDTVPLTFRSKLLEVLHLVKL